MLSRHPALHDGASGNAELQHVSASQDIMPHGATRVRDKPVTLVAESIQPLKNRGLGHSRDKRIEREPEFRIRNLKRPATTGCIRFTQAHPAGDQLVELSICCPFNPYRRSKENKVDSFLQRILDFELDCRHLFARPPIEDCHFRTTAFCNPSRVYGRIAAPDHDNA